MRTQCAGTPSSVLRHGCYRAWWSKLLTGTAPEARGDPSHLDQDGLSNSDRRSALARSPIRVVGATTRQSRAPPHRVRAGRPAPLGARFDRIC